MPEKDPYDRGFQDYWQDLDYEDNPFPAGSEEHEEWLDGWIFAAVSTSEGTDHVQDRIA